MAKLKNPLFSESAQGALGGLEYRNGTYGPIVGRRSITPHKMTSAQGLQRAMLKRAHYAWTWLTDADRAAWCAFATYPMTGRNAYVGAYCKLAPTGYTPTSRPSILTSYSRLYNAVISAIPGTPPTIYISYSISGSTAPLLLIYGLYTWSHRVNPNPRSYVYYGFFPSYTGNIFIAPPIAAPTSHIRLELVDTLNGKVVHSLRLTLKTVW